MVCSSDLLKDFPQFVVIHTVKGFGLVNKAEVDVFLELSSFFNDPRAITRQPVFMFCYLEVGYFWWWLLIGLVSWLVFL